MSRSGRRQWAAVRRMRGESTRAEQKPALSPPRIRTIATRSAKRLSGLAPTSARAGARSAASAVTSANNRIERAIAEVIARFHAPERAGLQLIIAVFSPLSERAAPGLPRLRALTIHIAFS